VSSSAEPRNHPIEDKLSMLLLSAAAVAQVHKPLDDCRVQPTGMRPRPPSVSGARHATQPIDRR
jgi:hypothetical protein